MDAYDTLRKQAVEKRDTAIVAARAEYRRSLQQIDDLCHSLGGDAPKPSKSKAQPVLELICALIPDRAFTVGEMVEMLRDAAPDRTFNVPTIRTFFPRLAEQGIIRKVSRSVGGQVLWAAADSDVDENPYRAMPMTDMAEQVLRECGPMRLHELVVAMQESGYRPDAEPRRLAASFRWSAKNSPDRFSRGEDGRWVTADLDHALSP